MIHDSATLSEQTELSYGHLLLAENSVIKRHIASDTEAYIYRNVRIMAAEERKAIRLKILKDIDQVLCATLNIFPLYRNRAIFNKHETLQNVDINAEGWIDFDRLWFKE
ncbi:MarR-like DNA-binding transcriptional regulator SgrR of sgrS sRNA [Pullulanibacillus pueri]|uniref:Uncharacterized protein n=1 Tax=Pullulanibacillus pueri TaxID=1437324 RepID=A0A8J2ZTY4_9BACL|nr:hypothetical protein [Pullulanibacillus pueri]MBM7680765.1 MarR-like DNA-binding transcriptional regulator SgrR of sgrS sRNA [Pullulanibacillus pueri]GGH78247.1 hypothetical protein GCM10007096_11380 [Pullulanibacillus pueri]